MSDQVEALKKLRAPFPDHQISLLPKPYKRDSAKGNCKECGGYHGLPAVHLKYVGHAALTDRLLDADLNWTWEPAAVDANGLPALDKDGGLWIRLTVCGVTRLGYGDAQGKTGGDAMKERIGDALRNAAMRFGAALDLWHKGDLHAEEETLEAPTAPPVAKPVVDVDGVILALREADDLDALKEIFGPAYKKASDGQKAAIKSAYDSCKAVLSMPATSEMGEQA